MGSLILDTIDLIDGCTRAHNAQKAAEAFSARLQPHGLLGVAARSYRRPAGQLTSDKVWDAAIPLAGIGPKDWEGSPGYTYICFQQNPLLRAVEADMPWFRFSDLAPHGEKTYGPYWEAFSEGKIGNGLGMLHYGPRRRVTSLSMIFAELDFSDAELAALRAAGSVLMERAATLARVQDDKPPSLTPRERDCMAYVAAGKSDWDISVILGIAQATVHFHIENARRKLNASTRAHAIARMAALDMI
ncbi:MAG: helix-turn-helix transcriptional regulator [Alphaproteobacteria bacterium]|nr:helix-turn-helix transcriptional regulator [Alphaproteobacteria bacterium]